MQRILDPEQIEALAERSIARVRLPDPTTLFTRRARRLRALSENHSLGPYLRLMAAIAEQQQIHLDAQRKVQVAWRSILQALCASVAKLEGFPSGVESVCERLAGTSEKELESQADALITARTSQVDTQAAPFVMAALQVYWAAKASALQVGDITQLDVPTVCPVCASLPVSSLVRSDKHSPGYRYLQCGLCATEWHMVRITCSHCLANEGIAYHSLEGGSAAIKAESCPKCLTYRKIFYQESDPEVDAVADDLASLTLDLLMSEEGFHRGSGNPLLWQKTEP